MSFGDATWQGGWVLGEEQSLPILKAAYDAGITAWDTADVYSNGASEVVIRKAIEKYKIPREDLVLMTKIFGVVDEANPGVRIADPGKNGWVNRNGLNKKHVLNAVDDCAQSFLALVMLTTLYISALLTQAAGVRRLGTYIDVLQIHRLDHDCEPLEIMQALHDVIRSGKVRYIGQHFK